jgi:hypothetical protein
VPLVISDDFRPGFMLQMFHRRHLDPANGKSSLKYFFAIASLTNLLVACMGRSVCPAPGVVPNHGLIWLGNLLIRPHQSDQLDFEYLLLSGLARKNVLVARSFLWSGSEFSYDRCHRMH